MSPIISDRDKIAIRVTVVTNGKRWIAHGESGKSDSDSLQRMEVECEPQWQTRLDKDMICVIEAEIPYAPNRMQTYQGTITRPKLSDRE